MTISSAMDLKGHNRMRRNRTAAMLIVAFLLSLSAPPARARASWWQISAALDYTPHGTQPMLAHTLISSDNCAGCHHSDNGSDATFFRGIPGQAR